MHADAGQASSTSPMDTSLGQHWGECTAFDDGDEADPMDAHAGPPAEGSNSPGGRTAPRAGSSARRTKITRVRPLRSCLTCNRRKIKCDRQTPCGPCSKRGEGDSCSLVAGLSAAHLTNAAIAERLAQLEARVEDLEAAAPSAASPLAPVPPDAAADPPGSTQRSDAQLYPMANTASSNREGGPPHRRGSTALQQPDPTSGETKPGYSGKAPGRTDGMMHDNVSLSRTTGKYAHEHEHLHSAIGEQLKSNLDPVASNCETEEAALALESLCRTEEVLDRSEVAVASLKASSGSVPFSAISAIKAGEFRSKTASSMSMGIILNPPLSESSNTPRTITMSPSERQYRSTILIDPTAGGMTGHRLQRSLDTRVRIFTSPNFPSKEFSDHIVWSYFRHLDPLWHVHIGWLFDDEYKEFWKLRNDGRHIEVDPAWGALLLMTLALGLQVTELPLPQHLLPHPSATSNDILALADSYICDVEELLNTSNWARSPQLRVLQTLALFSAFQSLQSLRDPTTFTMNGAGIRIAQILGLHDLGDTDNPNPLSALLNDDIAVPTGNQPLKEHLARMLWHALLVLELVHVSRAGIRIPLASTPYTTQLPINVDDTAFQVLPPSVPIAGAIKAKPPWQLTSVSSLHLRSLLSKNDKILLDLPADMKATDKYTHVMGFDAELRKWISASPTRQAAQHDYAAYKLSQWQHWSLMADVHGAIIHAHRPYMTRGYSDPRFSFSTKTCLESAKVLCESWQYLRDYITDQRFWWTSMRYLSAALVIFIDLFIAMDEGCPDEVLAQKRSDIPLICEILQERMSSVHSTTSMFAAAAFGVVSNLLEAEKAKKAAMIAKKDSTDGIAGVEVEPVGRVFKRIAQTMTSGSGIKPEGVLTGATSSNLPRTVSQDGTSTFHRSMYQSAEQAAVTQLAGAKRGKDAHRALVQAIELGRHAKTPRLSPTQGRPQTAGPDPIKTSFHGHLNSSASSPNIHLPSLASASSGSTPSFVMETDPHISQHDSFNPMPHGSFAWMPSGGSQNGQRQQSQADYTYLNDGSFGTTPQLQQTLAQGYQQQVQATPISWDTSQLFHPDPSVLLHSMGFPATPLQTSFSLAPPEHQGHNPAIVLQQEQFAPQAQSSSLSSSWYGSSAN